MEGKGGTSGVKTLSRNLKIVYLHTPLADRVRSDGAHNGQREKSQLCLCTSDSVQGVWELGAGGQRGAGGQGAMWGWG